VRRLRDPVRARMPQACHAMGAVLGVCYVLIRRVGSLGWRALGTWQRWPLVVQSCVVVVGPHYDDKQNTTTRTSYIYIYIRTRSTDSAQAALSLRYTHSMHTIATMHTRAAHYTYTY
jgi:hypothetical protein